MVSSVRMVQDDQLVDMRWEDFLGQFGRVCDGFETSLNQKDIQGVIHVYPCVSSIQRLADLGATFAEELLKVLNSAPWFFWTFQKFSSKVESHGKPISLFHCLYFCDSTTKIKEDCTVDNRPGRGFELKPNRSYKKCHPWYWNRSGCWREMSGNVFISI